MGLSRGLFHDARLLAATAAVDSGGLTRLHAAIKRGDHARAAELLAACPTPAARRALLAPATHARLMLLWSARDARMVELLLGAGADARARDEAGQDAITHAAATHGKLDVMRALLAALDSDAERQRVLASTLRFGVHGANLWYRAVHINLHRSIQDDEGDMHEHTEEFLSPVKPAELHETCAPLALASTHRCVCASAGIRGLQLLSSDEMSALVTPADRAATADIDCIDEVLYDLHGEDYSVGSDHVTFLLDTTLAAIDDTGMSWVATCVAGFQTALLALEAGAPLTAPVPARMAPDSDHTFTDDDHSRDEPVAEWLQKHSRWFGRPLVEAAVDRYLRRGRLEATKAARRERQPPTKPSLVSAPPQDGSLTKSVDELLAEIEGCPPAATTKAAGAGKSRLKKKAPSASSAPPPSSAPRAPPAVVTAAADDVESPAVKPAAAASPQPAAAAVAYSSAAAFATGGGAEPPPAAAFSSRPLLAATAVSSLLLERRAHLAALRVSHAVELEQCSAAALSAVDGGGAAASTDASAAALATVRLQLETVRAAIAWATGRGAASAAAAAAAVSATTVDDVVGAAAELAALQAHEDERVAAIGDEAASYAASLAAHVRAVVGPLEQRLAALRTAAAGLEVEVVAAAGVPLAALAAAARVRVAHEARRLRAQLAAALGRARACACVLDRSRSSCN